MSPLRDRAQHPGVRIDGATVPGLRRLAATPATSGYVGDEPSSGFAATTDHYGAVAANGVNFDARATGLPFAAVYDGTYINGTITGGVGLYGTPQNPVTVTGSGSVTNTTTVHGGDAIYGNSAAAWSILNLEHLHNESP